MNTRLFHLLGRTAAVALLFACSSRVAVAQEQPAPQRPFWQQAIDDFRKKADDRMKVLLEATDDEYAVLKPRIEKVPITVQGMTAREIATGQVRGTPRGLLLTKRGVDLDEAIDKVTAELEKAGGAGLNFRATGQVIAVEARA